MIILLHNHSTDCVFHIPFKARKFTNTVRECNKYVNATLLTDLVKVNGAILSIEHKQCTHLLSKLPFQHKASLSFGRYQIILLSDRDTSL